MTSKRTFILSREAERLGSDRELRRKCAAGLLSRVAPGVYMEKTEWASLDPDERYRARVQAASLRSRPGAQFSHDSAAAMFRLPSLGPWPASVHELVPLSDGGTSRRGIRRHGLGVDPAPAAIDGVTVTSLRRTLVDIACAVPLVRAVAMLDEALRPARKGEPRWELGLPLVTKAQLLATMSDLAPYRGLVAAHRAVEFADGASGSPAESLCRVQFHALGLPAPELQREFFDEQGSIGFADFYWRELDLVVEIDGRSKYGADRHFQRGASLDELVWLEKQREDRMRRVVTGFDRLGWETVNDRRGLAMRMARHGLIPTRAVSG